MGSDIYVGISAAVARQHELDRVANNLANVETTGFKADRSLFRAALESRLMNGDDELVPGAMGRAFVQSAGRAADLREGSVVHTGAPLDVAIRGPGFFAVDTPDGTRYTRAGSFTLSPDGTLTTREGFAVQGAGGPLQLDRGPGEIQRTGALVDRDGQVVGQLRVVAFEDLGRLEKLGNNLFTAPPEARPGDVPDAELAERSLERSNVSPAEELAALMLLQRAYDMAVQAVRHDDESTQQLIQEVSQ